jgi:phosphatidylcholine synthase
MIVRRRALKVVSHGAEAGRVRPAVDSLVKFVAWCVHLYTAMGLVVAAGIAVLLVRGGPESFHWSFSLMLLATIIDATDGTMARRIKVKKVLPNFDGRKLDDLTDYLNYTFLPLLLLWRAEVIPHAQQGWLLLPLLASAYGFCQVEAKTDDGFFLGFPSLWNVVAFYLYVLQLPSLIALAIVVVLSLLTFVPSRYLYPSQPGVLNVLSNVLGVVWAILLALILQQLPMSRMPSGSGPAWNLAIVSLYYPAFYMGTSWWVTLKHHRLRHALRGSEPRAAL